MTDMIFTEYELEEEAQEKKLLESLPLALQITLFVDAWKAACRALADCAAELGLLWLDLWRD